VTRDHRLPVESALYALGSLSLEVAAAEQVVAFDVPRLAVQMLRSNPTTHGRAAGRLLESLAPHAAGLQSLLRHTVGTMADVAFMPEPGPLQQVAARVLQRIAAAVNGAEVNLPSSRDSGAVQCAHALARMVASQNIDARCAVPCCGHWQSLVLVSISWQSALV
jgi:hypothetical protein